MTPVPGGDASDSYWMGCLFYIALPDTGTNKTLKWDWEGTGLQAPYQRICSITFWKGIDTSSPVRHVNGTQGNPVTNGAGSDINLNMTAVSGDKIVAWLTAYTGGSEGSINSWTNLSTLANLTTTLDGDAAWATGDPAGNVNIRPTSHTNMQDGSLSAIVLKPASGGGGATVRGGLHRIDAGFTHGSQDKRAMQSTDVDFI
jgi:hypothetical protein